MLCIRCVVVGSKENIDRSGSSLKSFTLESGMVTICYNKQEMV